MAPNVTTEVKETECHKERDLNGSESLVTSTENGLVTNLGYSTGAAELTTQKSLLGKSITPDNSNGTESRYALQKIEGETNDSNQSPDVDGGWAWVVFVAGFLQFLISSGMYYSFSVFYVELLQTFGESRAKTAWVYSTNSAVHMFSGPIGGFVIVRWGPRTAIILGGVLAALGYFLTAFASSLNIVFITYSFINALGTNLNFCGWIVGLTKFWNRHHALVLGIVMSGSGCGLFILGPSMEHIVHEFGWRGAMLICSGFSMNFCVFGATIYSKLKKTHIFTNQNFKEKNLLIENTVLSKKEIIDISKDDLMVDYKENCENNDPVRYDIKWEGRNSICETPSLTSQVILGSTWSLSKTRTIFTNSTWNKFIFWIKSLKKLYGSKQLNDKKNSKDTHGKESVRQLLGSPKFWLLEISCFLSFMSTTTLFAVLLDWTRWKGLSASFPHALAGSGAGDLLGRFFAGILIGRKIPPLILFSGIQLLLATATMCASMASSSIQFISSMVGFGVACGLQSVLYALMPSQLASGVNMANVLGYLLLVTGAGAMIGPPLAGLLVDLTNSYDSVMLLCTAAPAVASIFNLVAHFTNTTHHTQIKGYLGQIDQNSV